MEQGTKPSEWDFISFLLCEASVERKVGKSLVEDELMNEKQNKIEGLLGWGVRDGRDTQP